MLSHKESLQRALYDTLSAVSGLAVYDLPQQSTAPGSGVEFPYVVIGDIIETAWNTDTENGGELVASIHIWSRYRGSREIQQQGKLVYDSLHRQALSVVDYYLVTCVYDSGELLKENDNITQHAIERYRVFLDQTD